jgi:type VI secretion system protein VasD
MMFKKHSIKISFLACLLVLLGACKGENKMEYISIQFNAAASLNVDALGDSSPLDIRVYQMTDSQSFIEADFFSLYSYPEQLLEDRLLSQGRLEVRPQQKVTFEISLDPKAEYIGIVCAYRHLKKIKWKEFIKLSNFSRKSISVDLTKDGIKFLS